MPISFDDLETSTPEGVLTFDDLEEEASTPIVDSKESDIKQLQMHSQYADDFDKVYGKGEASKILSQQKKNEPVKDVGKQTSHFLGSHIRAEAALAETPHVDSTFSKKVEENEFSRNNQQDPGKVFLKEAGLATPATMAGMSAGEAAAAVTPGPPMVKAAAGIVTGGAVGMGVSFLGEKGLDALEESDPMVAQLMGKMGIDHRTRQLGREQQPIVAAIGQGASAAPFSSISGTIKQRAAAAALNTGIGAGIRTATGEEITPENLLTDAAIGSAFPGRNTKLGDKLVPKSRKDNSPEGRVEPTLEEPKELEEPVDLIHEKLLKKKQELPKNKETPEETFTKKEPISEEEFTNLKDSEQNNGTFNEDELDFTDKPKQLDSPSSDKVDLDFTKENVIGIEKPTWKETHDVLRESKTVGEGLSKLVENKMGTKGQRELASILSKNAAVANAKIEYLSDDYLMHGEANDKAAGLYFPDKHSVSLGKGGGVKTFIHEAVHAGTLKVIREGTHRSAVAITKLFNEVRNAQLSKDSTLTLEEFKKKHYGLTNPEEFASEALSNESFKKMLQEHKSSGNGLSSAKNSAWDRFKKYVKDAIGGSKEARTALDDALEYTKDILDESHNRSKIPDEELDSLEKAMSRPAASPDEMITDPETNAEKQEFVKALVTKYGKDFEKEAGALFDEEYANKGIVPVTHEQMADSLYALGKQTEADKAELFGRAKGLVGKVITSEKAEGLYQKATADGVDSAMRTKWQQAAEGKTTLTPKEQELFDKYIKPMEAELRELTLRQVELGRVKNLNMNEAETGKFAPRIMLPRKMDAKAWKEKLFGSDMGGFDADIVKEPGAMSERGYFVYEAPDGKRTLIMPKGKVIVGIGKNKQQFKFGENVTIPEGSTETRQIQSGDKWGAGRIKEATVAEIESLTEHKYLKDYQAVVYKRLEEARAYDRANNHLENMLKSDFFKSVAVEATEPTPERYEIDLKTGKNRKVREGKWDTLSNTDKLPQLAKYKFEPRMKAIIEDFSKVWTPNTSTYITNAIIKNMMLNPLPHMNNEAWHWYNARGLTGWITPAGASRFVKTMAPALKSVITQDEYYRKLMMNGGSILGSNVRNNATYKEIFDKGIKEAIENPTFTQQLKALGMKPVDAYNALSKHMSIAMWTVRDAMYVQLVKEQELKGKSMQAAIKEVERHMPSYRIPETVMGSRALSKVMQNPHISVFSRYHYGMMKSLQQTAIDMSGKNGKQHMKEGWDQAAAIGVAMAVLYPMADWLMDQIFDSEKTTLRRAGPYHLFYAINETAKGEKVPMSIWQSFFTFNPVLLATGEIMYGREAYSGKEIYKPNDSSLVIAKDTGKYLVSRLPQVSTSLRVNKETAGGTEQWLALQADVKTLTKDQVKAKKDWKKRNEHAAKARDRELKRDLRRLFNGS